MATKPILVAILRRKTPFFGDETYSRRHFEAENPIFGRRGQFSSPFLVENLSIFATKPILIAILRRKTPFLATKPILVAILRRKTPFLATKPILVAILRRKTPFFGDETYSRHHFEEENPIFWRRAPISSPF
ncbi:hypothetical protein NST61_14935 [Caldifermentibacillus hisashii]|uniref:hypothetical protein n=1 Tax=Caldifermentibacillus hisashii TaxID=996558 RepID=UPI0034D61848